MANRYDSFIRYVLSRCNKQKDKGFKARLRKAESETTEFQSWEVLANWGIDISDRKTRRAFGVLGACAANTGLSQDGRLSLGEGLRFIEKRKETSEQELDSSTSAARLRRLISCKGSSELLAVLIPVLRLFASREISICYSRVLQEVIDFDSESRRLDICARWAQDFYSKGRETEDGTE